MSQTFFFEKILIDTKKARIFLINKKDLPLIRADKENVPVLLTKEIYNTNMNTLLSDSNTYNLVPNNNIIRHIQKKDNEIVKEPKDLDLVDNNT